MNPWFAKAAVLLASIVMVAIRAPHGQRSRVTPVAKSRKGPLETALLTVAWIAFFLPLVWIDDLIGAGLDHVRGRRDYIARRRQIIA